MTTYFFCSNIEASLNIDENSRMSDFKKVAMPLLSEVLIMSRVSYNKNHVSCRMDNNV